MKKILILVEGQTEETFVRDVLAPHLLEHEKVAISTIVVTKHVKHGPNFKGGVSSYDQVKRDLKHLFHDSSAATVTTMLDYYAIPTDFPGYSGMAGSAQLRAVHLEKELAADLAEPRFVPYLSLHEFEALLFADPPSASWVYGNEETIKQLVAIRAAFSNAPETINNGPTTAPSKRVESAFPEYQKPLHGPMASGAAGLSVLRAACPHFNDWVTALER